MYRVAHNGGGLKLYEGDAIECMRDIDDESVQCCVTSPPYWRLRDYGASGQIGREKTVDQYVLTMVHVFREVRRVLAADGSLWLNLSDTRVTDKEKSDGSGLVEKNVCGIPWRVALALQSDGWILRQEIIWHKTNPMPDSVMDRLVPAHEQVFLLTKSPDYFFSMDDATEVSQDQNERRFTGASLKYGDRNARPKQGEKYAAGHNAYRTHSSAPHDSDIRKLRSVWQMSIPRCTDAHMATFPEKLPRQCILIGSRPQDIVLDPFAGTGTTAKVSLENGRKAIAIELNPEYCDAIRKRTWFHLSD